MSKGNHILVDVLAHAKPDDRDWTEAFHRYLDAEQAERERLANPVKWIRERLTLDGPVPMRVVEMLSATLDGEIGVRIETVDTVKRMRIDTRIDGQTWFEHPDAILDHLRSRVRELERAVRSAAGEGEL